MPTIIAAAVSVAVWQAVSGGDKLLDYRGTKKTSLQDKVAYEFEKSGLDPTMAHKAAIEFIKLAGEGKL